mgnify:FL=1
MTHIFVGIDCGVTGGVTALDQDGLLIKLARFDKKNPVEVMRSFFSELMADASVEEISVALEAVNSRSGQSVTSMFNFGVSYGKLQGFLEAFKLPYALYYPQTWQKWLPKASGPKDRVKAWALPKFTPDPFIFSGCRVPHQGCLDAAGIAEYHRAVTVGSLVRPKPVRPVKRRQAVRF